MFGYELVGLTFPGPPQAAGGRRSLVQIQPPQPFIFLVHKGLLIHGSPFCFFEKVQKGPEFLPTGRYSPKEIRPLRMSRTAVRDESLWFRFLTTVRGDGQEFFFAVLSQFGGRLCRRVAESPEKIKIRKNHGRKKQQRVLPGSGFGL